MNYFSGNQKNFITLFLLFMLFFVGNAAMGQEKLNAYFDHLFKNRKMMGSVSILHKDSVFYVNSIGYADANSKRKNDSDTKFRIGSITKTYTAVLSLKAIEDGKLRLDTYLASFYPQIKNADKITIEQLLKHRTGLFNLTEIEGEKIWEQEFHTETEIIKYFEKEKNNFEPNTAYEYSNTNYVLLGFILEKVYSRTFNDLLQEKICVPLKLSNTYFSAETDLNNNEAISYNIQNKYIQNSRVNFSNYPASGGIATTVIELNRFLSALFEGKLVSKKYLELMLPENKGEYGMGIEKLSFENPVGYGHDGRVNNYFSEYWYFPSEKLGIVTLCNAVNIDLFQIQRTLLQYAYRQELTLPDFNKTNDLTRDQFNRIMGTYIKTGGGDTITISSNGRTLICQSAGMGQMFIPLQYKGNNMFVFEKALFQFIAKERRVLIKDGDTVTKYKKL